MSHHEGRVHTILIGFILAALCGGFLQGCVSAEPPHFLLLPNEPMEKSLELAYPELETIYVSDEKIFVLGWMDVPKAAAYVVRVVLQNGKGENFYDDRKEITAKVYKNKPMLFYFNSIPLNPDLKAKLSPGNSVFIYCDDKLLVSKPVKYETQDIVNRNIQQIVILPFFSKSQETLDYQTKDQVLNTFADALACEIKRLAPTVIPHYIAEQKLGDIKVAACLQDPACRERLKTLFGEGIFITGNVTIPRYTHEYKELDVLVFDSHTGQVQKLKASFVDESERYIEPKMKKLIQEILYKKGLWAYLRGI